MDHACSIVPSDVLRKLAQDVRLTDEVRQALTRTSLVDTQLRKLRDQAQELTAVTQSFLFGFGGHPFPPVVAGYDCNHGQTLPGVPVQNPSSSTDPSSQRAYTEATNVAQFYHQIFGRDSIDDAGMTIMSSVHYGVKYNNAMWNGSQMIYGDGDDSIFIDFTGGNDVIGHELTHGVTQHTLQLVYANESGGLNESISDVFGSMFRQWRANQEFSTADWLIGSDIMGPAAHARNFTCLRDLASPAATHCLAPQPAHYSEYQPGMDPHYSSGIPNLAFYTFAQAVADPAFPNREVHSWLLAGKVWYQAMTNGGSAPNMTMHEFASRTHQAAAQAYPGNSAIDSALGAAWAKVGV